MKNALVTAGSSGIGRALVIRPARSGYNVITCARNHENLAIDLNKDGKTISTYKVDLRNEDEIKSLFSEITSSAGPLDVLVNSAGIGHSASLCSGETSFGEIYSMSTSWLFASAHATQ
jgi:NAD(P)-dependent dehydrogenase (short-subunit alcohol dehydrogenase family)